MRWTIVRTILVKELRETLRDRRTLLMMIGLPLLLYPLLTLAVSTLQRSQAQSLEAQRSTVVVWGELPPAVRDTLARLELLSLVPHDACPADLCPPDVLALLASDAVPLDPAPQASTGADTSPALTGILVPAERLLRENKAEAILVAPFSAGARLTDGRTVPLLVLFDDVRPGSALAHRRIADAVGEIRQSLQRERDDRAGLPEGFSRVISLSERNVATPQRRAGRLLGLAVPFLLIALSLIGGLYPAIDMTAGEKERGTMQTLLCAPIRPLEIVLGKFLAVWVIALTAGLANLTSLTTTILRIVPDEGFDVGWTTLLLALVMLAPVTFTVTATFLAVAALAKDFKDGQNFLTPVYTLLLLPSAITTLPTVVLTPWTAFVPIVNIALLIKAIFIGGAQPDLILLVFVAAIAFAGLAMAFAAKVFTQEHVLLGGTASWRVLLGVERRPDGLATPSLAFVLFALVLVVQFYGSLWLEHRSLPWVLVVLQYGFILSPCLVLTRVVRLDVTRTFSLRRPSAAALGGAILIGVSAWVWTTGVLTRLVTPPPELTRELERQLMLGDGSIGTGGLLLLVAVTPALCEESLFRGVVLSGLSRAGAPLAIAGSALLFGVAHPSVYRLAPTFLLGLVLGYVTWRAGSIACSMVVHALNNGLIVVLWRHPELAARFGWAATDGPPPWALTAGALAMTLAGLWLVTLAPRSGRTRAP